MGVNGNRLHEPGYRGVWNFDDGIPAFIVH